MNRSNISASVWESPVPPVLQFVFGVLGNFMALLILVCNSPSHRWHPFYKLVAGLALTDGGGILLLYPPILTRYATNFTFNLGSFFVWLYILPCIIYHPIFCSDRLRDVH